MKRSLLIFGVLLLSFVAGYWTGHYQGITGTVTADANQGRFLSLPKTEWLPGGRDMKLTEDFVYIDPMEIAWLAPKDSVVNGASIPRAFWTSIGGPFEGKYRNASIVHDVACEKMARPHDEVHRMFFHACVAGGVSERKAKKLYWAVAKFGPKWAQVEKTRVVFQMDIEGNPTAVDVVDVKTELVESENPTKADLEWAERYFAEQDPPLDGIESLGPTRENLP